MIRWVLQLEIVLSSIKMEGDKSSNSDLDLHPTHLPLVYFKQLSFSKVSSWMLGNSTLCLKLCVRPRRYVIVDRAKAKHNLTETEPSWTCVMLRTDIRRKTGFNCVNGWGNLEDKQRFLWIIIHNNIKHKIHLFSCRKGWGNLDQ